VQVQVRWRSIVQVCVLDRDVATKKGQVKVQGQMKLNELITGRDAGAGGGARWRCLLQVQVQMQMQMQVQENFEIEVEVKV
jgi:hypothetical protein